MSALDLSVPTEAETDELALTPPAAVAVVPIEKAAARVPLADGRASQLEQRAGQFASELVELDPKNPEFIKRVNDVTQLGNKEIVAASQVSNRMLERPTKALAGAKGKGGDTQVYVADGLAKLRFTVEELDPSKARGGIFGTKLKHYFGKYQSAQTHLNAILKTLDSGSDGLRKDNAAIDGEKVRLWETMAKLREYAELTSALDVQVAERIDSIRATDPDRAKELDSEVLFAIRQKHQDLLTQLAVSAQSYMALDMVRKNNVELIKGVERASTVTLSALRTAVIVAQALTNQKMVLDQITALNTTTENMILATSVMLKEQSAAIQKQASSSTISIETLQTAFQNVYDTMDAVDTYRSEAVQSMQVTVDALSGELVKAEKYLARSSAGIDQNQIGGRA
jgi:uncharacterized protein YaaN involved in tellurite resistance